MKTCNVMTLGGGTVDLLNPTPEAVDPHEIAVGLSRLPRWGGKTRADMPAYTVAQHSCNVAILVPPDLTLAALLHDAHEAIIGADICCPIRRCLEGDTNLFESLCHRWGLAIAERFGVSVDLFEDERLIKADMDTRDMERDYLMSRAEQFIPWRFAPKAEKVARDWYEEELTYCVHLAAQSAAK